MAKSTAMVKASEWEWTDDKERCFQMVLRGFPQTQIARELEVHKNTIWAWVHHPIFAKRLEDELREFATSSRLRRYRVTGALTDTLSNMAVKALKEAESKPSSMKRLSIARAWLSEFRSMRNEERLNFGDSTENHAFQGQLHHSGNVTTMSNQSFKQFLQQQIADGVIDAELVNKQPNPKAALVEAVQQSLIEGEVLRELDKEAGTSDVQEAEFTVADGDSADESA